MNKLNKTEPAMHYISVCSAVSIDPFIFSIRMVLPMLLSTFLQYVGIILCDIWPQGYKTF